MNTSRLKDYAVVFLTVCVIFSIFMVLNGFVEFLRRKSVRAESRDKELEFVRTNEILNVRTNRVIKARIETHPYPINQEVEAATTNASADVIEIGTLNLNGFVFLSISNRPWINMGGSAIVRVTDDEWNFLTNHYHYAIATSDIMFATMNK